MRWEVSRKINKKLARPKEDLAVKVTAVMLHNVCVIRFFFLSFYVENKVT